MIMHFGSRRYTWMRQELVRYTFFDDPIDGGADAIYGLDRALMNLVDFFKSASHQYGTERRILLLHGPVGSSKSTIARLLKKGLEYYSKLEEGGAVHFRVAYSRRERQGLRTHLPDARGSAEADSAGGPPGGHRQDQRGTPGGGAGSRRGARWIPSAAGCSTTSSCGMTGIGTKSSRACVRRLVLSEKDRVGIGTFQPKDEKNQDSTELTGDINYRKIAEYGSDSDPRAFNFDGELNIANRGMIEFIEVLKLDVAFLYDLLGASQEHVIKPKKFAQTHIDEVIVGHTNEPEYKKLQNNELMEAFRDRTIKIDVPYNIKLDDEIAIYNRDFNKERIRGIHIAPHTIEMAAMWAVMTRLEEPKKPD